MKELRVCLLSRLAKLAACVMSGIYEAYAMQ